MSWCCIQGWLPYAAVLVTLYVLFKYFKTTRKQKALDKWSEKSKTGKVILHGMYGNSEMLPTPSPFVLKLETYLRFAGIPYEVDKSDIWGPKGKTPWISHNGKHLADSQFIIEYLSKEYGKQDSTKYTSKELAVGTMVRVMVEEHLYWMGVMWRFAFGGRDTFQQVINGEKSFLQWSIFSLIAPQMRSVAWSQGVGRHSESEIIDLMRKDLLAISAVLGNKQYLLGDEMCEDDCSVFAGLASAVFMQDFPLKEEFRDDLANLKEYCERVRDKLWPDWDSAIKKAKND